MVIPSEDIFPFYCLIYHRIINMAIFWLWFRNKWKIIDVMEIKKLPFIGGNFVAVQGLPACSRPTEGLAGNPLSADRQADTRIMITESKIVRLIISIYNDAENEVNEWTDSSLSMVNRINKFFHFLPNRHTINTLIFILIISIIFNWGLSALLLIRL